MQKRGEKRMKKSKNKPDYNKNTNLCIKLPESIIKLARIKLKGKMSRICQQAIESQLDIDDSLGSIDQEIANHEKQIEFLLRRRRELEEEMTKRPKKLRMIS